MAEDAFSVEWPAGGAAHSTLTIPLRSGDRPEQLECSAQGLLEAGYDQLSGRLEDLQQAYRNLQRLADAIRKSQQPSDHLAASAQPDSGRPTDIAGAFKDMEWRDVWFLCANLLPQGGPVGWPAAHHKTICARRLIEQPDGDLIICDLARKSQVRLSDRLEVTAWILGGTRVLLGADGADGHYAAPRPAAAALARIFEVVWEAAVPVPSGDQPAELTRAQWRVLRLLGLGLDDLAMAQVTRTSVRTIHCHVAAVLAALDARTRLAAGVSAAARGWLG